MTNPTLPHYWAIVLLMGVAAPLNACAVAVSNESESEMISEEGFEAVESEAELTEELSGATEELSGATEELSGATEELSGADAGVEMGASSGTHPGRLFLDGAEPSGGIEYVVAVSTDGLGALYLKDWIDSDLPGFKRLRQQSASTLNARADATYTITLPNHSSMLTSLPVSITPGLSPEQAHGYTANVAPEQDATLHNSGNENRSYIPSVFDVVHDQGLKTAMYSTKGKFVLFEQSYNMAGAEDITRDDNGREKIDTVFSDSDHDLVLDTLLEELSEAPANFTFLHLAAPDKAGHVYGWGGDEYFLAVQKVDALLGRLLDALENEPLLAGRCALILTSDHGGQGYGHSASSLPIDFTVPFFLWSPGRVATGDLYELTTETRRAPAPDKNPPFSQDLSSIRNADLGNLALEVLSLPLIEGSATTPFGG